jgi:hypothetical protein
VRTTRVLDSAEVMFSQWYWVLDIGGWTLEV